MLTLEDVESDKLALIWGLLDDAFENMEHEILSEVWGKWESAHRQYGQPMVEWCANVRRFRMELQEQDWTHISVGGLACNMRLCSGLSHEDTSQVFCHCGSKV